MMHKYLFAPLIAAAGLLLAASAGPVQAQNVEITPLGVVDGDFCGPDRALLFKDPDGTTILYDPGRTVRGPADARLVALVGGAGNLDGLLLSSVHRDHLGEKYIINSNCFGAGTDVPTVPDSNTAEILAGHPNAFMPGPGELSGFMKAKVVDAGGSASQVDTLRPGGLKKIGGVKVAVIPAFHSNGIGRQFLTGRLLTNPQGLTSDGLTAYVGPDNGFVLTFTNGLVVYLTADTGQFGDMKTIVRGFYADTLSPGNGLVVVANMGGKFSMGPVEAAWAVKTLVNATAVIPEHANQPSTTNGVVNQFVPGTSIETNVFLFIAEINGMFPVHVPLSGIENTMHFDSAGVCQIGPPPCLALPAP